eukprot:c20404_g1_i1 orf=108-284(+)
MSIKLSTILYIEIPQVMLLDIRVSFLHYILLALQPPPTHMVGKACSSYSDDILNEHSS